MSVHKSVIENMTLATGTELYVQASGASNGKITLSFDGSETAFSILLTPAEALEYKAIIEKVLEELKNV